MLLVQRQEDGQVNEDGLSRDGKRQEARQLYLGETHGDSGQSASGQGSLSSLGQQGSGQAGEAGQAERHRHAGQCDGIDGTGDDKVSESERPMNRRCFGVKDSQKNLVLLLYLPRAGQFRPLLKV